MANIKSAEKRIKQTAKRQLRNRGVRSQLKTAVKQYRELEDAKKGERSRRPIRTSTRRGKGRDPQERRRPLQVPPRPKGREGEGSVKGPGSRLRDLRP
jgi:hypothetical protein